jgi:hypothetical protein
MVARLVARSVAKPYQGRQLAASPSDCVDDGIFLNPDKQNVMCRIPLLARQPSTTEFYRRVVPIESPVWLLTLMAK